MCLKEEDACHFFTRKEDSYMRDMYSNIVYTCYVHCSITKNIRY
jgi:hypothetical protein